MQSKLYIGLVISILVLFAVPQFAVATTYHGAVNNPHPWAYTTLTASGGSNGGLIYCEGYKLDPSHCHAYATIYIRVTPTQSGKIEIGVDWHLRGHISALHILSKAKWIAWYYWCEPGHELYPWNYGGVKSGPFRRTDCHYGGWWTWEGHITDVSHTTSEKRTPNEAVTQGETISIGILIKFSLFGSSHIQDAYQTSGSLYVDVNSITYQYA